MGEYTSTAKKGKEIATAVMLFGVAIGIFYLSKIPGLPVPALFQLLSVFLLVGAVVVITRHILRQYTCRLEPNSNGMVDFVIVEHYGRRNTTVCRVYTHQVLSVARFTKEEWKASAPKRKGKQVYRYTAGFFAPDRALAEVREEETGRTFFLLFSADDSFLNLLQSKTTDLIG